MRELAKSVASLSWALSLVGARQLADLARGGRRGRGEIAPPRQPIDAVAQAAQDELEGGYRRIFQAGDRLQRSMLDLAFGIVRPDRRGGRRIAELSTNVVQQSATFLRRLLP